MKWLVLALLVSCGAQHGSGSGGAQVTSESVRPVRCATGALPSRPPRDADYLAFPNFSYQGIGRCRGYSILTQRMLLLSRFAPGAPRAWDCDANLGDCQNKVRELLTRVTDGHSVIIPGYANLAEFSAEPAVQEMIKSKIISYGHRYMANPIPISGTGTRSQLVLREAMRRVRLNQIPYLGISGQQVGDHAVLGYAIGQKEGTEVLCIRDPNVVPEQGKEECENYMFQDGDSIRYIRYARPDDLILVQLTDDEDRRMADYRRTLCSN